MPDKKMSDTFSTYLQIGFLDFESYCITNPAEELLKKEIFSGHLLDVASGYAPYLVFLNGYESLTLLDRSPLLLEMAQKKAEELGLKSINCVESLAEKLPFESNSFDSILCSFALCDLHDWKEAFLEIERVIKPGGDFVLIDCIGGNNDFLYDLVQIADVLEEADIGRESAEIWCFLLNYLNCRGRLLKYEEFKISYRFPGLAEARLAVEGMETRMKSNPAVREKIYSYLECKKDGFEIDAVYLKIKMLKTCQSE